MAVCFQSRILAIVTIDAFFVEGLLYHRTMPSENLSSPSEKSAYMGLSIMSPAFKDGEKIPGKYTCDADDLSPPLSWSGAPAGTKSYALIMDDPDAPVGVFTHWVIFNINGVTKELGEAVPKEKTLAIGAVQGRNDFGSIGYGGPCPPPGKPHKYRFHVYALDITLSTGAGASKRDLLRAMDGHILGEAGFTGIYGR